MKKLLYILLILLLVTAVSAEGKKMDKKQLFATFDTSLGKIVCELYSKEAPQTVTNFTGLAEGKIKWTDPKTKEVVQTPLYNGTVFHRVIPNFMIQGGDPLGLGIGGPGYQFQDEISPNLHFDKVGRLAMANSGPNTNGSQFFITVAKTPWLDGHHTIFGQVIKGQDIADKIANAERSENDRPVTSIVLNSITITNKL
ncbi:MAG: peptidylprolyl isomerase [Candidatus Margulisiibacteriota bacterium]